MKDKNINRLSAQNSRNDVPRIDISNGIPVKDFIQLLEEGTPFELIGEDILHFSAIDIKRINVAHLNSISAQAKKSKKEEQTIKNNLQSSAALTFAELENLMNIKDLDITDLEKKMLLSGEMITVGKQQLSIQNGKLDIQTTPPQSYTPKQKI